jgi:NADPH-dependent 2,4-dienoyl-CoA reductase/sulfur reductase-like enzyme
MHYEQELVAISDDNGLTWTTLNENTKISPTKFVLTDFTFPLLAFLSGGSIIPCDFIVSATGVKPQSDIIISNNSLERDNEGFIRVDKFLSSSVKDIFAAGDCCSFETSSSSLQDGNHFFQMRLWTQARLMGLLAAHSMLGCVDKFGVDAQFEIFAHITRFFGFKVVMLGRYNAQGLGSHKESITKEIIVTQG